MTRPPKTVSVFGCFCLGIIDFRLTAKCFCSAKAPGGSMPRPYRSFWGTLGLRKPFGHNIQYIDKNRQEISVLPGKNFVLFPHNGCGIIKQLDDKERR